LLILCIKVVKNVIIIIIIMLRTREIHADREVTANRPDIIINNKNKQTNKRRETLNTDKCGNTSGHEYHVKGSNQ